MALETMKGLDRIGEEPVRHLENGEGIKEGVYSPIVVDHDHNVIMFRIQRGPIKEAGKNGCQVTDMIAVAKHIIEKLNEKFPCEENGGTILDLYSALEWQEERTKNREKRNVEGTSNA